MQIWRLTQRPHSLAPAALWLLLSCIILISNVAAEQTPKTTAQLVIAQLGNPTALDSWNWSATSEQDIMSHMLEPLVQYDRQAKLRPMLAESLEMKSPTEWIIKICKGVKFHHPEFG